MTGERVQRVLVVCTGNTCRSPLAAAMLRRELDRIGRGGVEVLSAGTSAAAGASVSDGSYLVGLEHGLDLTQHRARQVTPELLAATDLVLTMTSRHRDDVLRLGAREVATLSDFAQAATGDIADPFGQELESYRETYAQLEPLVTAAARRLAGEH